MGSNAPEAGEGPAPGDPGRRGARHHGARPGRDPDLRHRRALRRLARADPVLLRVEGPAAGRGAHVRERPVLPAPVPRAAADAVGARAARPPHRALASPGCCPSTSAWTSGRSGSRSGCARSAIRRWRRSARRSTAAGASRSPTSSARAATTGEFPEGVDADELGLRIGALIDGLAIQVLMNDTSVHAANGCSEVCLEVAAKLIGFSLEPRRRRARRWVARAMARSH